MISRARPPQSRHNSAASLLPSAFKKQRSHGSKTAVVLTPEALGSGWPPHATMDMTNSYGNLDYLLRGTKYPPGSPPDLPEATLDGLDHLFDVLVAEDDLTVSLPADTNSRVGNPSLGFGADGFLHTTGGSLPGNADACGDSQHNAVAASSVGTLHMSGPDTLISLSRLNEDIGQQLADVELRSCEPSPSMPLCFAEITSSTENSIAKAVQSTTSFVAILKSLSPLKVSNSPETWSASDSGIATACTSTRATVSPLGMATYLLLLSTYLQLIQLYNTMFSHMTQVLGNVTGDTMGEFQPRPEFRIAGLPAMPSRLYIKILIEIIEHQFESVELLMGLPAEYRISGRTTYPRGIFNDGNASALLQLIMGDVDHEGRPGDVVTGKSVLVSLRENIKAVQKLLRG